MMICRSLSVSIIWCCERAAIGSLRSFSWQSTIQLNWCSIIVAEVKYVRIKVTLYIVIQNANLISWVEISVIKWWWRLMLVEGSNVWIMESDITPTLLRISVSTYVFQHSAEVIILFIHLFSFLLGVNLPCRVLIKVNLIYIHTSILWNWENTALWICWIQARRCINMKNDLTPRASVSWFHHAKTKK